MSLNIGAGIVRGIRDAEGRIEDRERREAKDKRDDIVTVSSLMKDRAAIGASEAQTAYNQKRVDNYDREIDSQIGLREEQARNYGSQADAREDAARAAEQVEQNRELARRMSGSIATGKFGEVSQELTERAGFPMALGQDEDGYVLHIAGENVRMNTRQDLNQLVESAADGNLMAYAGGMAAIRSMPDEHLLDPEDRSDAWNARSAEIVKQVQTMADKEVEQLDQLKLNNPEAWAEEIQQLGLGPNATRSEISGAIFQEEKEGYAAGFFGNTPQGRALLGLAPLPPEGIRQLENPEKEEVVPIARSEVRAITESMYPTFANNEEFGEEDVFQIMRYVDQGGEAVRGFLGSLHPSQRNNIGSHPDLTQGLFSAIRADLEGRAASIRQDMLAEGMSEEEVQAEEAEYWASVPSIISGASPDEPEVGVGSISNGTARQIGRDRAGVMADLSGGNNPLPGWLDLGRGGKTTTRGTRLVQEGGRTPPSSSDRDWTATPRGRQESGTRYPWRDEEDK